MGFRVESLRLSLTENAIGDMGLQALSASVARPPFFRPRHESAKRQSFGVFVFFVFFLRCRGVSIIGL